MGASWVLLSVTSSTGHSVCTAFLSLGIRQKVFKLKTCPQGVLQAQ